LAVMHIFSCSCLNVVQMVVIIVSVFLYGRLYLALSGLEFAIMKQARMRGKNSSGYITSSSGLS